MIEARWIFFKSFTHLLIEEDTPERETEIIWLNEAETRQRYRPVVLRILLSSNCFDCKIKI